MRRRIGIDVGGTNTDAVLLEDDRVLHAIKTPTTADVLTGVRLALQDVDARFLALTVPLHDPPKADDRWNRVPAALGTKHREGLIVGFGWPPS